MFGLPSRAISRERPNWSEEPTTWLRASEAGGAMSSNARPRSPVCAGARFIKRSPARAIFCLVPTCDPGRCHQTFSQRSNSPLLRLVLLDGATGIDTVVDNTFSTHRSRVLGNFV